MSAKQFLDTNIFVYSFDESAPAKKAKAVELIGAALYQHSAIVSTQVVQEFLNVALKKFDRPLSPRDCKRYLEAVLSPICSVYPNDALYAEALELVEETQYSFYDYLILAAAIKGGCEVLLSEDLQHGQIIRRLRIENPFQGDQT